MDDAEAAGGPRGGGLTSGVRESSGQRQRGASAPRLPGSGQLEALVSAPGSSSTAGREGVNGYLLSLQMHYPLCVTCCSQRTLGHRRASGQARDLLSKREERPRESSGVAGSRAHGSGHGSCPQRARGSRTPRESSSSLVTGRGVGGVVGGRRRRSREGGRESPRPARRGGAPHDRRCHGCAGPSSSSHPTPQVAMLRGPPAAGAAPGSG